MTAKYPGYLFAATTAVKLDQHEYVLNLKHKKQDGTISPKLTLLMSMAPCTVIVNGVTLVRKNSASVDIYLTPELGEDGKIYYEGAAYHKQYSYRVLVRMGSYNQVEEIWFTNNGDMGFIANVGESDWRAGIEAAEWRETKKDTTVKYFVLSTSYDEEAEQLTNLPGYEYFGAEFSCIEDLINWERTVYNKDDLEGEYEASKYVLRSKMGGCANRDRSVMSDHEAQWYPMLETQYGIWTRNYDKASKALKLENAKEAEMSFMFRGRKRAADAGYEVHKYQVFTGPVHAQISDFRDIAILVAQDKEIDVVAVDMAWQASISTWRDIV